jgi:hypothetical protein
MAPSLHQNGSPRQATARTAAGTGALSGLLLRLGAKVVWLLLLFGGEARPATAAPNRYLLVVETSRIMQPRAPAAVTALRDLVSGGMAGQMRPGDSLGVWTFNNELHTGELPLQQWTPETAKAIAGRIAGFLQERPYEKNALLEKVLPAVEGIAGKSENLTILLVCSGEEELSGTPFDLAINQTFRAWRERQRRARMPFVTVLRARQGHFTDFAVTSLPWSVELPPASPESELLAKREKPLPQRSAVSNRTAAPLIVSGKKPETGLVSPEPQRAPVTAVVTNPAAPARNETTAGPGPEPVAEQITSAPAAVRLPEAPVPVLSASTSQVPNAISAPISGGEGSGGTGVVGAVQGAAVPDSAINSPATQAVVVSLPVSGNPPQPSAKELEPAPAATPPGALVSSNTGPAGISSPLTEHPVNSPTEVASTNDSSGTPLPPAVAAGASEPFLKRATTRLIFLGGAAFAFGCLLLLYFRKPRVERRASVITRSMDKDPK